MLKNYFYRKEELWSLFLICAFPLLFWSLLLSFRDVGWLTERTNSWDAISVVGYAMALALVESIFLFIVAAALGLLVARSWGSEKRIALMGVLVLISAMWAMIDQLHFLMGASAPLWAIRAIAATGRPVLTMYIIALGFVSLSVLLPTYAILRKDEPVKKFQDFTERISTLTMFYLFLSFVGLVIILIRNL